MIKHINYEIIKSRKKFISVKTRHSNDIVLPKYEAKTYNKALAKLIQCIASTTNDTGKTPKYNFLFVFPNNKYSALSCILKPTIKES